MSNAVTVLNAALEGRYTIERELGEGGMATVYLADDLKHGRKVALKLLKPELAAVVGAERFLVEIKTTANLQHPHILPLFDSGEVDGLLYYIMPFIDGESLSDKLKRETQLSVKEALGITEALAGALDYAHRHGVVHRDIKPGNILLQEGQPLVADFGIALAVTVAAGDRITETGLSLGTPPYMSPEQAAAERELDGRSDQYSLACVLYEMLAGQPPFNAPTAQATVAQILAVDPPPLLERRRTVPAGVATAVHRALEKVPADRFDTAGDFAEAVTTGEYWTPVEVRGAGAASPSQSPALVRTTAAALVAVLSRRPRTLGVAAPGATDNRHRRCSADGHTPPSGSPALHSPGRGSSVRPLAGRLAAGLCGSSGRANKPLSTPVGQLRVHRAGRHRRGEAALLLPRASDPPRRPVSAGTAPRSGSSPTGNSSAFRSMGELPSRS